MIRVLHIVDSLDMGGIQTFLLNVYRNIDRSKIKFDILVFREHKQVLEDEFINLGSNIYKLPNWRQGYIRNRKSLKAFFEEHKEYKIVHYHAGTLAYIGPINAACKAGIPVRVMHSHNTKAAGGPWNKYAHLFHKKRVTKYATDYFACGELAGKWMFGGTAVENNVRVINNGIKTADYAFNEEVRCRIRKELEVDDRFVIGHVGRFSIEKNHTFLIDIVDRIRNVIPNAVLLCAGDGVEKANVEEKVKKLGLENYVKFLGIRRDIQDLFQAFDIFVLPSLFEGFPVVLVEAEAAGLPCVISDSISKEVVIKDNVKMISLDSPIEDWINEIRSNNCICIDNQLLIEAGFDIKTTAAQLTDFYFEKVHHEII